MNSARSLASEAGTTLGLFVPGTQSASWVPGSPRIRSAPALERILARGDRLPECLPGTTEAALFDLFGIDTQEDQDLPVAAVTRMVETGTAGAGWWIRADPVSLEPLGDGLVLHAGESLELTPAEAISLATALHADCREGGWQFEAPHALRWYLQPPAPPADLRTTPLPAVIGRDIGASLPAGRDGGAWRRRMSEFQLLLHGNPVNQQRQDRGLRPINSLWFWGGGVLPASTASPWNAVWTDDLVVRGLARLCGADERPMPLNFQRWMPQASTGRHLVILNNPDPDTAGSESGFWSGHIARLEDEWFGPAVNALQRRQLESFILHIKGQRPVLASRAGLRRWWRRRRVSGLPENRHDSN